MFLIYDPDEWENVSFSKPCGSCGGDLSKCNGCCTGSFIVGKRRRDPSEVAAIKARKRLDREDAVLVEADAIRAQRTGIAAKP